MLESKRFYTYFHKGFVRILTRKDSVKKGPVKQDSSDSGSTAVNGDGGKPKEKVDYKARLQHKQYLVSISHFIRAN